MRTVLWKRDRVARVGIGIGLVLFGLMLYLNSGSQSPDELEFERFADSRRIVRKLPWIIPGKLGNLEPTDEQISDEGIFPPPNGITPKSNLAYGMNMTASDILSMERIIPDTRPDECKYWNYPERMGLTTSVVIAFHNEGWSTLLRTVHTVFKRTPAEMLQEVILVDDASASELENLQGPLEEYIKRFNGKVKIIRMPQREGLIRTRTAGARASTGDVIVFLDAHCEVNRNWLPPLLAPIYKDRTVLTVPVIDGIDFQNFKYHSNYGAHSLPVGIFEWGMLYKEQDLPAEVVNKLAHKSAPYKSPTHAGGLFAIERKYFMELGAYDPGLMIWGAENFELSFKVWQCGGSLEWVPCSRVGHVYRGHPFNVGSLGDRGPKGVNIKVNYKRVIEVWFDEKYKEMFYARDPMTRYLDHGDISEQLAFKKRYNCKAFSWFMENVASELLTDFPELPHNLVWGEVRNKGADKCLDGLGQNAPAKVGVFGCHGGGSNQLYRLNAAGQLGFGERCIDIEHGVLSQMYCAKGRVDGPWEYDQTTHTMLHKKLNKCLGIDPTSHELIMRDCEPNNTYHQWIWKEVRR